VGPRRWWFAVSGQELGEGVGRVAVAGLAVAGSAVCLEDAVVLGLEALLAWAPT
jgi:hypothetical protein